MPEDMTLEGKLVEKGGVLSVEKDGTLEPIAEKGLLWRQFAGCMVRLQLRDGLIQELDGLDAACPYTHVGPEEPMRGRIVTRVGPPGTKLAGSVVTFFDGSDGVRYGATGMQLKPGPHKIQGRKMVANMAYAARSTEKDVWIVSD